MKDDILKINLSPTLNRASTYNAYPTGKPVNFSISYCKKTPALKFQVDTLSPVFKDNTVMISMFRNLDTSQFCQTFFDLETTKNDKFDYRFKFSGINRLFDRDIFRFQKEKLDFNIPENGKSTNNYLLLLGWKTYAIEDELLYFFVQRRCYNNITRTNIIRTAGLQFATQRGLDTLDKYTKAGKEEIKQVDAINFS